MVRALFIRDRIKVPTYIQSHDFAYIVRLNIDTKRVKQISMREPNGSINVDEFVELANRDRRIPRFTSRLRLPDESKCISRLNILV